MIQGKTVLAIIPARGGSKGLPRKNIKELAGKPLIAWTIEESKKSKYIDRLILSSEDEEIIRVAKEWGCDVPFIRPKKLAKDDTPGIQPVLHSIKQLPGFDFVVLLQPTSPLRTVNDIDNCIEKSYRKNKSCVSVVEADKTPYWMYKIDSTELLLPFMDGSSITRRQEAPKVYALNGAVYVAKVDSLITHESFLTNDTISYVMDKNASFDIDTELDFEICEFLICRYK
jgi:CMP-N,N'-diacetyllegionaminic acid synthase